MSSKQSSYVDCPLCFETFSTSVIASHASTCTGQHKSSTSSPKGSKEPVKRPTNSSPGTKLPATQKDLAKKRPLTSAATSGKS